MRAVLAAFAALLLGACSTAPAPQGKAAPAASPAKVERLLKVSARVLPQFPHSRCEYCALHADWTPNASMNRRGYMEITTGLMELCATDDQLAFVLAHELSHEALHHARRRLRNAWLQALAAGVAAWAVHEAADSKTDAALAGGGVFLSTALLATLPAMRRMETEADLAAREAIGRAGYRVEAAVEFWQRYTRARPGRETPEWLSDHPRDASRLRALGAY